MKSAILTIRKVPAPGHGLWLRLSCGHRYKWAGSLRPHVGEELACPECNRPTVAVIIAKPDAAS